MNARAQWIIGFALVIGLAVGLSVLGGDGSDDSAAVTLGSTTESTRSETPRRMETESTPPSTTLAKPVEAESTPPGTTLGVYVGAANVNGANQFGASIGNPLDRALDFVDGSSWSTIESPTWQTSAWRNRGYRMDFSIPMLPDGGGSLTTGASGGYNSHFVKLAQDLVANGHADAIVRPGWEFNLKSFSWYAGSRPGAYAAFFRQVVTAMRSVPGQRFEFEWNPSIGTATVPLEEAYPGDRYVDYIGLDIYDQSWIPKWQDPVARWKYFMNQTYGLRWHRDFSARHDKPMTFPEWGVTTRPDGHGGGDNPYFVTRMHEWIRTNNVAAHYYFEYDAPDGDHSLTSGKFPKSAARFKQLFGAATS